MFLNIIAGTVTAPTWLMSCCSTTPYLQETLTRVAMAIGYWGERTQCPWRISLGAQSFYWCTPWSHHLRHCPVSFPAQSPVNECKCKELTWASSDTQNICKCRIGCHPVGWKTCSEVGYMQKSEHKCRNWRKLKTEEICNLDLSTQNCNSGRPYYQSVCCFQRTHGQLCVTKHPQLKKIQKSHLKPQ